jgi:uncharacterized protein
MSKRFLNGVSGVALVVVLVLAGAGYLRGRAVNDRLIASLNEDDIRGVEAAVRAGASVHTRGDNGQLPLMVAGAHGSPEFVRYLLNRGAAVDASNHTGCTGLVAAAITGNGPAMRVLLVAGADPNALPLNGQRALAVAKQNRHRQVIPILQAAGAR